MAWHPPAGQRGALPSTPGDADGVDADGLERGAVGSGVLTALARDVRDDLLPRGDVPDERVRDASRWHREVPVHDEELARGPGRVVATGEGDVADAVGAVGGHVLERQVVARVGGAVTRGVAALEEGGGRLPRGEPVADAVGPVARP